MLCDSKTAIYRTENLRKPTFNDYSNLEKHIIQKSIYLSNKIPTLFLYTGTGKFNSEILLSKSNLTSNLTELFLRYLNIITNENKLIYSLL